MDQTPFLPPDFLASMRLETDPSAEHTITALLAQDLTQTHHLYKLLATNRNIEDLPESSPLYHFFSTHSALPEWTDEHLRLVGQDVFRRYGVAISMLLFYVSLPAAYCCPKGARVLTETGRLISKKGSGHRFTHRLMETAQFVLNVMEPGSFLPDGQGIQTALKVRLIHASIRHYLKTQTDWDVEKYGEPINQEDMAGTLMSFSAMILQGLDKIGYLLTEEEKEGYFHCWRVVGHFMGLRPELLPTNYQDGIRLGYQIFNEQKGPSQEGEELLDALVNFVCTLLPPHLIGRHVPITMIRYLMEPHLISALRFKRLPFYKKWPLDFIFTLTMLYHKLLQRPNLYLLKHHIGQTQNHFLQKMLLHFNEDKEIKFRIPPSLQKDWQH